MDWGFGTLTVDLLCSWSTRVVLAGDTGRRNLVPAEIWAPASPSCPQGTQAREEDPISRHGWNQSWAAPSCLPPMSLPLVLLMWNRPRGQGEVLFLPPPCMTQIPVERGGVCVTFLGVKSRSAQGYSSDHSPSKKSLRLSWAASWEQQHIPAAHALKREGSLSCWSVKKQTPNPPAALLPAWALGTEAHHRNQDLQGTGERQTNDHTWQVGIIRPREEIGATVNRTPYGVPFIHSFTHPFTYWTITCALLSVDTVQGVHYIFSFRGGNRGWEKAWIFPKSHSWFAAHLLSAALDSHQCTRHENMYKCLVPRKSDGRGVWRTYLFHYPVSRQIWPSLFYSAIYAVSTLGKVLNWVSASGKISRNQLASYIRKLVLIKSLLL